MDALIIGGISLFAFGLGIYIRSEVDSWREWSERQRRIEEEEDKFIKASREIH